MKNVFLTLITLCLSNFVISQTNFELDSGLDSYEIPFESISNLIIVKATFNKQPAKFILDTGASNTLLFNWDNMDSLSIRIKNKLLVQGYGSDKPVTVYYTEDNSIEMGAVKNDSAIAFVTADRVLDLQPQLGIFINGVLGADFFKNQVVRIDYNRQVLNIFRNIESIDFKLKRYDKFYLDFQGNKPYVKLNVFNKKDSISDKFLVDTGSSEALWITKSEKDFEHPQKKIEDYLGYGINGDVYGYRSKLDFLELNDYRFNRVAVSFPFLDQLGTKESIGDSGSIGGEILRRFIVIFDYKNNNLYLRKTAGFNDGFYFNMSGIQVRVGKTKLYTLYTTDVDFKNLAGSYGTGNTVSLTSQRVIEYNYIPELFVNYVRAGSPAFLIGIKEGDQIINLEGLKKSRLTMKAVIDIFYEKSNKIINIEVLRDGKIYKYKFKQVPLID